MLTINGITVRLGGRTILDRATAVTCAGCHRISRSADLGGGLVFPRPAGFVHVGEAGVLSLRGLQQLCHEAESAIDRSIEVRPWRFDVARNRTLALLPDDIDACLRRQRQQMWLAMLLESAGAALGVLASEPVDVLVNAAGITPSRVGTEIHRLRIAKRRKTKKNLLLGDNDYFEEKKNDKFNQINTKV